MSLEDVARSLGSSDLSNFLRMSHNDDGTTNLVALGGTLYVPFSRPGTLAVAAGVGRGPIPRAGTILAVIAAVGTAPVGAAIICDVNKNGVTIFTNQTKRATIFDGANVSVVTVPDVVSVAAGDLLWPDVDQVGSSVAGSDLTVGVLIA